MAQLRRSRLLYQRTQLRETFDRSYFLYLKRQEIMDNALDRLQKAHKQEELKKLEEVLNALYLRKDNKLLSTKALDSVQKATEKFIEKKIKNVKVDADTSQIVQIGQKEHEARIYDETIKKRAEIIDNALEDVAIKLAIQKKGLNIDEIKSVVAKLKGIVEGDAILSEAFKIAKTEKTVRKIEGVTAKLIEDFDNYYNFLRGLSSNPNITAIYGEAFERALSIFNNLINRKKRETVKNLVEEAFSETTKTLGATSVNRGSLESDIFDEEIYGNKEKQIRRYTSTTKDKADEIITIRSFNEKSGKADVEFQLPEIDSKFKISAKSWNSFFDGHTFNETSLFDAMIRTVNLDYTSAYGLVVGYYNPVNKLYPWVQAHELAKTCILLDTVMGYSQKNNWVDTIVVENRGNKNKPISVYSIEKILKTPMRFWSQYINYNPKKLNLRHIKRNDWWLKKIQEDMHKIKVSVKAGITQLGRVS